MDTEARNQYMDTLRERYFKGTKKEKGAILSEYCRNTGQERKYAIKKFRYKVKLKSKEEQKRRKCFYGGEVMAVLVDMWKIFDYPCGARLEEILFSETERLRRFGEITCSDAIADKLKQMKSATIDRRLNHEKEVQKLRARHKKKSSFLLSSIPTKTSAEWDRAQIGNIQVDFVESCGSSASGEYVNNLSTCDISLGWWEGEAVMGKGQRGAREALDNCRTRMPFAWREFHPDNGTNLLNFALWEYAQKEELQYSRSRPYRKNDNCFIEQKNSTHIRQVIGYLRYDTREEMDILNDLYRNELRLYKNFFQPIIKLARKERVGGKLKRKYDRAKTPYRRLMESDQISDETKKQLAALYESLNPARLKRSIDQKLARLWRVHGRVHTRKNVKPSKKLTPSLVSFPNKLQEAVSVS
jgi:hypothetical protein